MKCLLAVFLLTASAGSVTASVSAHISGIEMAKAVNEIAGTPVYRYGPKPIRAIDIRVLKCIAPDEEPTEFTCIWQHRESGKWVRYKTPLAIGKKGWQVID